jgi:hypothetical protein
LIVEYLSPTSFPVKYFIKIKYKKIFLKKYFSEINTENLEKHILVNILQKTKKLDIKVCVCVYIYIYSIIKEEN